MQEIYKRTPMPKCEFNKVAKQLPLNPIEIKFKARFFDFFYRKGGYTSQNMSCQNENV